MPRVRHGHQPEVRNLGRSHGQGARFAQASSRPRPASVLAGQRQIKGRPHGAAFLAKGILMERDGITRGEAFDVMRRALQETNTKLDEVARRIVAKE
ncbi:MAG: ANTAR domain-containing protein [Actinomycetota bacterium]